MSDVGTEVASEVTLGFAPLPGGVPVVVSWQGSRRGQEDTEPAFEVAELLRRQLPSSVVASGTPDFFVPLEEDIPGAAVNVYDVTHPKGNFFVLTINKFSVGDTFPECAFELAQAVVGIVPQGNPVCVLTSHASEEVVVHAYRDVQVHNGLLEVLPGVFDFSFGGLLRQAGLTEVTEVSVLWPAQCAHLGIDGMAVYDLGYQVLGVMGAHAVLDDADHPFMRAIERSKAVFEAAVGGQ